MILELDKLEMLLIVEEEKKKMEKRMLGTNIPHLLYPPPNPPNPTIFPIKTI